jgi:hypothetical protein
MPKEELMPTYLPQNWGRSVRTILHQVMHPRSDSSPEHARRRSRIGWLVALGTLGCAMMVPVVPAQAYVETPPWLKCSNSSEAVKATLEQSLSPANGSTVTAGSPVTFSGSSEVPLTFAVASSSALLSNPDIDSGPGSVQASTYTFTSTKAAATPRIVYWEASFSDASLAACQGLSPTVYTTHERTLTVLPSPAEEAAAKKQQEEAAAKKKQEEEGAAQRKQEEEAAAATRVSLDGGAINVGSTHEAAVKLSCTGADTCSGKLTLTTRSTIKKGKKPKAVIATIGTTAFSLPAGRTATVEVKLDAAGRALLGAGHGRLSAILTVLKSSPAPSQTQTENVHLTQQVTKAKK